MFERIPQKIKKILKRIGVVAFLVITVLSVAITYSRGVSTEETKECYKLGLYGEYSIDGGENFESFEDVIYINTSKSDNLIIKGHFDMDIPAGTVRIRKKGSAGGHNGIKSVLYHVQDEHFARVRIGIGRPPQGWTVVKHVLSNFSQEDSAKIQEAIEYLLPAVECIVTEGIDLAMNRFNPKQAVRAKRGRI